MENILKLDCLEYLNKAISDVTPEQMAFFAKRQPAVGKHDKVVGTLHNDMAKRLWCASIVLSALEDETDAKIQLATNDLTSLALHDESHRYSDYSELAKAIFWTQVKSDLGIFACGKDFDGIGICEGWMVVKSGKKRGRSLVGEIDVKNAPPEIREALRKLFGVDS